MVTTTSWPRVGVPAGTKTVVVGSSTGGNGTGNSSPAWTVATPPIVVLLAAMGKSATPKSLRVIVTVVPTGPSEGEGLMLRVTVKLTTAGRGAPALSTTPMALAPGTKGPTVAVKDAEKVPLEATVAEARIGSVAPNAVSPFWSRNTVAKPAEKPEPLAVTKVLLAPRVGLKVILVGTTITAVAAATPPCWELTIV